MSSEARNERPISRRISWVRPDRRSCSRLFRGLVAYGSMLYSAVSQPTPRPVIHSGTPGMIDAAQITWVLPQRIRAEP